jgi:hypothetical protein
MTAMDRLPAPKAREACRELAKSTVWPAEEWAIATMRLLDHRLPMDEMGMARLIQLTLATKAAPSAVADRMVLEYSKALASSASTD